MLISIVVPIYNVENYLEKCIKSLLAQTYDEIEILLINDGSPDRSPEICKQYAKQYPNIRVFTKENGGLSDARNYGLERAKGEYVLFVDSDDYITSDGVQRFVNYIRKQSIRPDVILGQCNVVEQGKIFPIKTKEILSGDSDGATFLKTKLENKEYPVQVWTKLYRREFLLKNSLFFEKGLLHEDELFTPLVFLRAEHVSEIENSFYMYVKREGSIMTGKDQRKNAVSIKRVAKILQRELEELDDPDLKGMMFDHIVTIYYQGLSRITKQIAKEEQLIDLQFLNKYSKTWKNRLRYCAVRFAYPLLNRLV